MPKNFCAPEAETYADALRHARACVPRDTIIKVRDESTPYLGSTSTTSMRVLERLERQRAGARMSANGRLLDRGSFRHVPDAASPHRASKIPAACSACRLTKTPPEAWRTMLKATQATMPPARRALQLRQLGWQILHSYVVRNGDLHSEEHRALLRSCLSAAYARVYDVVTVQAYTTLRRQLAGPVHRRPQDLDAQALARNYSSRPALGVAPSRIPGNGRAAMRESAVEVGKEQTEAAQQRSPVARVSTRQMLHAWNEGMRTLPQKLCTGKAERYSTVTLFAR